MFFYAKFPLKQYDSLYSCSCSGHKGFVYPPLPSSPPFMTTQCINLDFVAFLFDLLIILWMKNVFRIDQIEDELIHEKLKIKAVSDDVDGTFKQMAYI